MFATMVKLVVSAMGKPSGMTREEKRSQYKEKGKYVGNFLHATAQETQLTIRSGTSIQVG
jgi:hypothetical protein